MKRFLTLTLTMLLLFCSCQKSESRPLTDEEIQQVNDAFFFITAQGDFNPLPCFCMDYYETSAEMPLRNFLLYFPSEQDVTDSEEFKALQAMEEFPFNNVPSLKEVPVPVHRIPAASVNDILSKYAAISTDELINTEGVTYLPETDAYYTTTSDVGGAYFDCSGGELNGETALLRGNSSAGSSVLSLKKSGEQWLIVSHLPNE